jgi:redox-sensitive bicupin YhaK (pirin superfamily)
MKSVEVVIPVERKSMAPGLSIAQVNHRRLGEALDPYLMFDHFNMAAPFFRPHPHAGFSAVTYMLPESKNGFINRDSLGNRNVIEPGAIHWTVAGRGVVHEEVPVDPGVVCNGLQMFVNLHSSKKMMEPKAFHAAAADIPVVRRSGGEVRVVVGSYQDQRSYFQPPVDVTLLDVVLESGATFEHQLPKGWTAFLYVLSGAGRCPPPSGATEPRPAEFKASEAVGFSVDGEKVMVEALSGPLHFVFGAGAPLREPVIFHGPFCMNTKEQISKAIQDYQSGQMGHLESSF